MGTSHGSLADMEEFVRCQLIHGTAAWLNPDLLAAEAACEAIQFLTSRTLAGAVLSWGTEDITTHSTNYLHESNLRKLAHSQ